MENTLAIILLALIAVVCFMIVVGNLINRRRRLKRANLPPENLELIKKQGIITEAEFDSLKDGVSPSRELSIELCTISAEEMIEAIDAALNPVNELDRDKNYAGDEKWAEAFGIHSAINLSLKELTLLSMKVAKPREAIDIMAEIVAMNVPIDALEAAQNRGRSAFPNYRAIARMIWIKTRARLSDPISVQKEIHKQQTIPDQSLLAKLTSMIMRTLKIPTTAAGFAVILALAAAKMEFNAFSHESEDDSC